MGRHKEYPDRMELRLPDGWRDQLTALADERGVPQAEEARIALAAHLGLADYVEDDDGATASPAAAGASRGRASPSTGADLGPF